MNLKPLGARLVVKPEDETTTASGIVIPDTAEKDRPQRGTVLAVGAARTENNQSRPLDVAVGDKVLFGKYSGQEIKFDEESYLILKEDDLLAVISE